jgi:uncharacterized membrane protein YjfL (UPF0719 family)
MWKNMSLMKDALSAPEAVRTQRAEWERLQHGHSQVVLACLIVFFAFAGLLAIAVEREGSFIDEMLGVAFAAVIAGVITYMILGCKVMMVMWRRSRTYKRAVDEAEIALARESQPRALRNTFAEIERKHLHDL